MNSTRTRVTLTALLTGLTLSLSNSTAQGNTQAISILINDSPWFPGFKALVEQYQKETGRRVNLNVTPFAGMLQKTQNAVTAKESEFDLVNLNEQWYMRFYADGQITPLKKIDPAFKLDPQIIEYDYATRWDARLKNSNKKGEVLGLPINGNIQLLYYRKDLFDKAGLAAPKTWADVEKAAKVLHDAPNMYGFAARTSPPDYDYQGILNSYMGSVLKYDTSSKQWEVNLSQDVASRALDTWVRLGKTYGPRNYANLGQADMAALMSSGRLAMGVMVSALAPSFEDPKVSSVVGKVAATVVPGATATRRATMSGIWVMGIPQNLPTARKKAALDFLEWATSKKAQMNYARAGAIPVRQDVFEELGDEKQFAWMKAMAQSTPFIKAQPRVRESAQIIEVLNRRLPQVISGGAKSDATLDAAAREIHKILTDAGYKVKPLR
ncbi:extracellular solute-binding protein [Deinococcus deserti]|uniref:Putative sugar ABC transporter, periplasmic component n=1 Tax=Deinococcus deserti (strain DSM 17065 / CIP 109153 / LMG 22923 / VCD115) TaxID=546414 RepID=C1D3G2_DEIDV|nr:extracellular solute-binding protein [Deinococcus deserti]ACO48041.1 putative sugar ABC transporter, periplasmic component [Deinococcus deserti VCD115]